MRWREEVERAAAREFGHRHYRAVIGLRVARTLAPALLTIVAAALVVWGLVQIVRTLLPALLVLTALGALVAAAALVYRLSSPFAYASRWAVIAVPASVVAAAGLGGSLFLWLR